jgi:hypothetical protein
MDPPFFTEFSMELNALKGLPNSALSTGVHLLADPAAPVVRSDVPDDTGLRPARTFIF